MTTGRALAIGYFIGCICASSIVAIAHIGSAPPTKRPTYQYKIHLTDTNGHEIVCPVLPADIDYLKRVGRLEIIDIKFTGLE